MDGSLRMQPAPQLQLLHQLGSQQQRPPLLHFSSRRRRPWGFSSSLLAAVVASLVVTFLLLRCFHRLPSGPRNGGPLRVLAGDDEFECFWSEDGNQEYGDTEYGATGSSSVPHSTDAAAGTMWDSGVTQPTWVPPEGAPFGLQEQQLGFLNEDQVAGASAAAAAAAFPPLPEYPQVLYYTYYPQGYPVGWFPEGFYRQDLYWQQQQQQLQQQSQQQLQQQYQYELELRQEKEEEEEEQEQDEPTEFGIGVHTVDDTALLRNPDLHEWVGRNMSESAKQQTKNLLSWMQRNAIVCSGVLTFLRADQALMLTDILIRIMALDLAALSLVPEELEPLRHRTGGSLLSLISTALFVGGGSVELTPLRANISSMRRLLRYIRLQRSPTENVAPRKRKLRTVTLLSAVRIVGKYCTACILKIAEHIRRSSAEELEQVTREQIRLLRALFREHQQHILRDRIHRYFAVECQIKARAWLLLPHTELKKGSELLPSYRKLLRGLDEAVKNAGGTMLPHALLRSAMESVAGTAAATTEVNHREAPVERSLKELLETSLKLSLDDPPEEPRENSPEELVGASFDLWPPAETSAAASAEALKPTLQHGMGRNAAASVASTSAASVSQHGLTTVTSQRRGPLPYSEQRRATRKIALRGDNDGQQQEQFVALTPRQPGSLGHPEEQQVGEQQLAEPASYTEGMFSTPRASWGSWLQQTETTGTMPLLTQQPPPSFILASAPIPHRLIRTTEERHPLPDTSGSRTDTRLSSTNSTGDASGAAATAAAFGDNEAALPAPSSSGRYRRDSDGWPSTAGEQSVVYNLFQEGLGVPPWQLPSVEAPGWHSNFRRGSHRSADTEGGEEDTE